MLLGKTRVHLNVGDPGRSAAFYEALLGAAPSRRTPTTTLFDLDSPPLVLTLEAVAALSGIPGRGRSGARHTTPSVSAKGRQERARFTLVVNQPREVGDAAIALRRAGVPIRIEDHGIAAHDPDENAWHVRFVPSAPGRAVVEAVGDHR